MMSSEKHNSEASEGTECAGSSAPSKDTEASLGKQSGGKPPQSIQLGPQPLDKIMEELELKNHDLVEASTEGLTHKQVNKGRKGRRLTRNIQDKIATALSVAADKSYSVAELFTYK